MASPHRDPDRHGHDRPIDKKAAYARDAEIAAAMHKQLTENPLTVDGYTFRFAHAYPIMENDRFRSIFQELQKRGLCTLVMQERESPDAPDSEAMYVDDRLDDATFRDLYLTVADASRIVPADQELDLAQVVNNVLNGGNFSEAVSISEEYRGRHSDPA